MQKLLIKVLLTILLACVICFGINTIYILCSYSELVAKYRNIPQNVLFANTGTSHGEFAFDYSDTSYSDNSMNFAIESQAIYYDYQLVNQYIDNFVDNSILFIVLDYFTFWYYDLDDPYYDSKNLRYYTMLDYDRLRFSQEKTVVERYMPSMYVVNSWIGTFVGNHPEASEQEKLIFGMKADTSEEKGAQRATYHMRHAYSEGKLLPVYDENVTYLCKLIQLCKENGIIPVLVTTPYRREYSEAFSTELLDVHYSLCDSLCKKYGIEYWDYSRDERFADSPDLFAENDFDHLNSLGANMFTNEIIDRSEKLLLK